MTPEGVDFREQFDAVARSARSAGRATFSTSDYQTLVLMDQLLDHLESVDPGEWRLHGSAALLARGIPGARLPKDLDLESVSSADVTEATNRFLDALNAASDVPVRFTVREQRQSQHAFQGMAAASINGRQWKELSLDILPQSPHGPLFELVGRMVDTSGVDLRPVAHYALPSAQQAAEKASAIMIPHSRARAEGLSSRYKDVVDLVLISRHLTMDVEGFRAGLQAAAESVQADVPDAFVAPSDNATRSIEVRAQWMAGVTKALTRAGLTSLTYESAEAACAELIGPVLDGTATKHWSPEARTWGHELAVELTPTLNVARSQSVEIGR